MTPEGKISPPVPREMTRKPRVREENKRPKLVARQVEESTPEHKLSEAWAKAHEGSAGFVRTAVAIFLEQFRQNAKDQGKLNGFLLRYKSNLQSLTLEGGQEFVREAAGKHLTNEQQVIFEQKVSEAIEKASRTEKMVVERTDKIKAETERQEVNKLGVQLYRRLKCFESILDECEGEAKEALIERTGKLLVEIEELVERTDDAKVALKKLQLMGAEKIAPLENEASAELKKENMHMIEVLGTELDGIYQKILTKSDHIVKHIKKGDLPELAPDLSSFLFSPNPPLAVRTFIDSEWKKIEAGGLDLDFGPGHYSGPIQLILQLQEWIRTFRKFMNIVDEHQLSHPPAQRSILSRIFK